jgi:hypothetical protein
VARTAADGELTVTSDLALARGVDDEELRALLRKAVLPGAVRVAFTREPDYFAGEGLAGSADITLVARQDDRLVGMGRCSVNTLYRNGTPHRVAYLGELRVDPGATKSAALLRDGYAFLVRHAGEADGYFTSIAGDNLRARRVLEHGPRLGLPRYSLLGDLVTLVIPVGRVGAASASDECDPIVLTEWLDRQSRQYQLSMTWQRGRWGDLLRHGVSPSSAVVAMEGTEISAAAAIWDQRAFRQTVIDGYDDPVRMARPLYNGIQSLRGMAPLPSPGSVLPQGFLLGAFVSRPDAWIRLWPMLANRARTLGLSWLSVSRQADDPELPVLRRLAGVREYHTSLYAVDWNDGPRWVNDWDGRPFRPEVSLL